MPGIYDVSAPDARSHALRTRRAGENMQPWRCATCGKAVRKGHNDPCDCTREASKMDPNATWQEMVQLAESIQNPDFTLSYEHAERFAELTLALRNWLAKGGFPPSVFAPVCAVCKRNTRLETEDGKCINCALDERGREIED